MGNQTVEKTTFNALSVVYVSGLCTDIVPGCSRPLLRKGNSECPTIHGESGLDSKGAKFPPSPKEPVGENHIFFMHNTIATCPTPVTFVCTAALTNLALLLRVFPKISEKILEVVLLGGAIGVGNIGPVMEWNIMVDPEAAKIVFESGLRIVQIPLNVSHTVLVTKEILQTLRSWNTPFTTLFVEALIYFEETYRKVFGFEDGPPLHDPLAVAYVIAPELFEVSFMRVDIETTSELTSGQTVCDIYNVTGRQKNVHVATKVNVERFWNLMLDAFSKANASSPLNLPSLK
eukprot:TRINITY_DN4465_c0_g2_i9.p1 TRINITY_DN4465_c0_g2~~TRINITY_DN4465_c0_g2_i9.p1  ORF type:complete len:289 (-),score=38.02 TRINITY_DN4465_c0_g2_i9:95-961(-)